MHGSLGTGAQGYEIGGMENKALWSVAISLFGIFAYARIIGGEKELGKTNCGISDRSGHECSWRKVVLAIDKGSIKH